MGVTQVSSQASSAWAGTWDCMKILLLLGSIPQARYIAADLAAIRDFKAHRDALIAYQRQEKDSSWHDDHLVRVYAQPQRCEEGDWYGSRENLEDLWSHAKLRALHGDQGVYLLDASTSSCGLCGNVIACMSTTQK